MQFFWNMAPASATALDSSSPKADIPRRKQKADRKIDDLIISAVCSLYPCMTIVKRLDLRPDYSIDMGII